MFSLEKKKKSEHLKADFFFFHENVSLLWAYEHRNMDFIRDT